MLSFCFMIISQIINFCPTLIKEKSEKVEIEIVCNKFDMIVSFYGFMNLSPVPFHTATPLKYEFGKTTYVFDLNKKKSTRIVFSLVQMSRLLTYLSLFENVSIFKIHKFTGIRNSIYSTKYGLLMRIYIFTWFYKESNSILLEVLIELGS